MFSDRERILNENAHLKGQLVDITIERDRLRSQVEALQNSKATAEQLVSVARSMGWNSNGESALDFVMRRVREDVMDYSNRIRATVSSVEPQWILLDLVRDLTQAIEGMCNVWDTAGMQNGYARRTAQTVLDRVRSTNIGPR